MNGGPQRPGGSSKVVRLDRVKRAQNGVHPIFTKYSKYAVTAKLALQLSQDSIFKSWFASSRVTSVTQLGDLLSKKTQPLYLEKKNEQSALRLYARILMEGEDEIVTSVISNMDEMGVEGNRLDQRETELYLEGSKRKMFVRTIEGHMQALRMQGRVERLKYHVEDMMLEECVLSAIDQLSYFKADHVRDFLIDVSRWPEETIA